MKYLKLFEDFNEENALNQSDITDLSMGDDELGEVGYNMSDEEDDEYQEERLRRSQDEEFLEKKKMNAGFKSYLDKKKAKSKDKDDKKGGKSKPDFLDLDKDGDKKETMKKAAKDAKDDKITKRGLTAGQKRLPEAMQKAILKKQK